MLDDLQRHQSLLSSQQRLQELFFEQNGMPSVDQDGLVEVNTYPPCSRMT